MHVLHCCFILSLYPMSSNLLDCHKHKNTEIQFTLILVSLIKCFEIFDYRNFKHLLLEDRKSLEQPSSGCQLLNLEHEIKIFCTCCRQVIINFLMSSGAYVAHACNSLMLLNSTLQNTHTHTHTHTQHWLFSDDSNVCFVKVLQYWGAVRVTG